MRVLLAHNLHPDHPHAGGGQRVTADLAAALARRGLDVHVVYLGDRTGEWPLSVTGHRVESSGRLLPDAYRMGGAGAHLVHALDVDVVHGSAPEAAGIAPRLPPGVGLVATTHHPDPPDLGDRPPAYRPVRLLGWARRRQGHLLERSLLRRAHRVVAVSEHGRDLLRERGYVGRERPVAVIPNGISPGWLEGTPADPGAAAGVLFVGRLDAQKGVDVLLRALARLPDEVTLEVVGEGPDRTALEELARGLGLEERVRFAGRLPSPEVRSRMREAAVVAAPSRYELFGMVLLEAMAVGVPVVGSAVGGMREVVRDGVDGLLVPPDDPEALARALKGLLQDPEARRRLGRGGRERALTFAWDELVGLWVEEMEAAVAAAGGGG